jgi:two-component system, LytTR family, sensor kinase
MPLRKFLILAAVGPLLGVSRILGLLASFATLAEPVRLDILAWTMVGCIWWGLLLPFIVYWSERDPLMPGQLGRLIPLHLVRALVLSVASGLAIWASHWVGEVWLGTPELKLRTLWSNLFQSWWLFDLFMYAVALSIVSAIEYEKKMRATALAAAQLETALAQTELKLLKAELDPHFVFNALHTISALVHRDPASADRMIARLSDFLRLSLASTGAQEVSLQQELEHLRAYMEVQMVRFRGRLTLDVDVPPELLSARVPNLLLQPLIENVVKHAVSKGLRPVHAVVRARRQGDEVEVEIADDGPGLGLAPDRGRREGIGLANTRGRLEKLYPGAHRLVLEDRSEGGARVVVALPYRLVAPGEGATDAPSGELAMDYVEELRDAAGLHR